MSRTVRQLRHSASRRLDDLWVGTLTVSANQGTKQLADAKRVENVNFFSNGEFYIDQDALGEEHRIVSSGAGQFTIAGDGLSAAKALATVYELHKRWSLSEYNEFLDDAILDAASEAVLASVRDESLTVVADQYEYTVPSGIRYIQQVWQKDSSGDFTEPIFPHFPMSVLPGTPKKLSFSKMTPLTTGRVLRILGQGVEEVAALDDTSAITIDSSFLVKHMEVALHRIRAAENSAGGAASGRLLRSLEQELELRREAMSREHRILPGSLSVLQ